MDVLLKVLEWFLSLLGVFGLGWFIWWRWHRDETGPLGFALKVACSIGLGLLFLTTGVGLMRSGGASSVIALGVGGFCAWAMFVVWKDDITGALARPFSAVYDDQTPLEPKPLYTKAEAAKMAGDIPGAIAAVRAELEKFPNDFDGHLRLAALLAEQSEDLPGALAVIEAALALKDLTPGQIAYALNTAADWHLKFARDPEAARRCLERIPVLVPDSTASLHAIQRLANLTPPEMLAREDNRQPIAIPEFERKLGLKRKKFVAPAKPDINAAEQRLRERLARHANDWTAREELARLYVEEFEFFERGLQELEILITSPGQPKLDVVRWLHQKADWQVKFLNDVEAGRATLKRIQELYPNSAFAERAATAMYYLQPTRSSAKKKAGEESPAEE